MANSYTITNVTPTVYIDRANKAVNGFIVTFHVPAYDESHNVRVAKMDADSIKKEIDKFISERAKLAAA